MNYLNAYWSPVVWVLQKSLSTTKISESDDRIHLKHRLCLCAWKIHHSGGCLKNLNISPLYCIFHAYMWWCFNYSILNLYIMQVMLLNILRFMYSALFSCFILLLLAYWRFKNTVWGYTRVYWRRYHNLRMYSNNC